MGAAKVCTLLMRRAALDYVFLRRYSASGNAEWTQTFGTFGDETATGVTVDALGNVYVAGFTGGSLEGTNAGNLDVFLRKFNASGGVVWTRQFGTGSFDMGYGVSVDAGGSVYVTGITSGSLGGDSAGYNDVFVRAYAANGNVLWSQQFGSSGWDEGYGIAVDARGNVYVTGSTTDDVMGDRVRPRDVFLSKLVR